MTVIRLKVISAILVTLIVGMFIYNSQQSVSHPENAFCKATVNYELRYNNELVSYTIIHRILLPMKGSGYDNLKGQFNVDGKSYSIARTLRFQYDHVNRDKGREVNISAVEKTAADTLPDEIASKYINYLSSGTTRYLRLDDIDNNKVLISDAAGPAFICSYDQSS